eukprot:SAG11_NODE_2656_length_3121_cov_2.233212_5_plen_80_part_00
MIVVSFYYRFVPPQPAACTNRASFFLEIFVCTRFTGVPFINIAHIQANVIWVLRSRKTYSRYLKKTRPSDFFLLFLITQ